MNDLLIKQIAHLDSFTTNPSFYLYDLDFIDMQLQKLQALPSNVKIYYAMKANSNLILLNYLSDKGSLAGIEIASSGELKKGLLSFDSEKMIFTGPGKAKYELEESAISKIKQINIESFTEAVRLDAIIKAKCLGPIDVLVRVNINYQSSTAHTTMAGKSSKLGIDEDVILNEYDNICRLKGLKVRGIHVFAASGFLESESILGYFDYVFQLSSKLRKLGYAQECIDLGGGFGIDYSGQGISLDVKAIGRDLGLLIEKYGYGNNEIILELGRFIVGEAGLYVTEIIDIKRSHGKNHIITAGGINHQRRPCAVERNHPVTIIPREVPAIYDGQIDIADALVDIDGPLCLTDDILGKDIYIKHARIGDLVVVKNSGAYGYSMAALDFLSHPYPPEYLVKRGELIGI